MLTTADNPWNPHTHFDEWHAEDQRLGYHTLAYVARVLDARALEAFDKFHSDLSEAEQSAVYEDAIDEIIELNGGLYRRVEDPAAEPSPSAADVLDAARTDD